MENGNEAFAINYGSVAIGTEIWANRMKRRAGAPMRSTAKFEEFFLSSWVGGDPALIVDVPANAPGPQPLRPQVSAATAAAPQPPLNRAWTCPPSTSSGTLQTQLQTEAQGDGRLLSGRSVERLSQLLERPGEVPRDPRRDECRARSPPARPSVAADAGEHREQAARQPDDHARRRLHAGDDLRQRQPQPDAGRLDLPLPLLPALRGRAVVALARARRVRVGDEARERRATIERPAPGSRALPDGEIASGTPIPALVPMPTLPMAPIPPEVRIATMPPAATGPRRRAPAATCPAQPPRRARLPRARPRQEPRLPVLHPRHRRTTGPAASPRLRPRPVADEPLDGGLPRHVVLNTAPGAAALYHQENVFDFSRDFFSFNADNKHDEPRPA